MLFFHVLVHILVAKMFPTKILNEYLTTLFLPGSQNIAATSVLLCLP